VAAAVLVELPLLLEMVALDYLDFLDLLIFHQLMELQDQHRDVGFLAAVEQDMDQLGLQVLAALAEEVPVVVLILKVELQVATVLAAVEQEEIAQAFLHQLKIGVEQDLLE
jgi:hypothetical protein